MPGFWKIYTLLVCLVVCLYGEAQNNGFSVKDTMVIRQLLDSADKFRTRDSARFLSLAEQALELSIRAGSRKFEALSLQKKSVILKDDPYPLLYRALHLATELKDTALLISIHNSLGYRYNISQNPTRALDHYFTSLRLVEKKPNDKDLSFLYSSIGGIYTEMEDIKGLEFMEKGLQFRSGVDDSSRLVTGLTNLGWAYSIFGQHARGIFYTETALRWAEKVKNARWIASALLNLCRMYSQLSNEDAAALGLSYAEITGRMKNYAGRMLPLYDSLKRDFASPYYYYGIIYQREGNYAGALYYLHESKQMISHLKPYRFTAAVYQELSSTHASLKNLDSAYYYYRAYRHIEDSVSGLETKKEITRRKVEFEFSRIRDSLEMMRLLSEEKLKQKELLSLQQMQAIELQQVLLDLSRQEQQVSELAYQKASAELLVNRGVVLEREKQLTITRQDKELQAAKMALQESQLTLARRQIQAQKNRQFQFLVGSGALILLLLLLFYNYKSRQRTRALIAAEKLKTQKAEAVRKMAEFEMHGLRAQLNPHFMFNSLNAIQGQILREKTEIAGEYLTTFARMLRQLLENAEYSFIPLAKELEFLKLYLSMEQLRIPELEYIFHVDERIDTSATMIPNMILQPYIENAIWHGLSHKSGGTKEIRIEVNDHGESVSIRIRDNGVGREKAAEMQSRYRKEHKSKGMELLRKRFELIQVEFGSRIRIDVEDLVERGHSVGTCVHLEIPYSFSEPMMLIHEAIQHN